MSGPYWDGERYQIEEPRRLRERTRSDREVERLRAENERLRAENERLREKCGETVPSSG